MQEASFTIENYQSLLVANNELVTTNQLLEQKNTQLQQSLSSLQSQLAWFKKQLVGETSEKFQLRDNSVLPLFAEEEIQTVEPKKKLVGAHERRTRGKTQDLGDNQDSGLRFDDGVEIVVEDIYPDEIEGLAPEEYEIIGSEFSDRLASRVSKTYVHRRVFHKAKLNKKDNQESKIVKAPVPVELFSHGYLSLSFIVDMIIDKCLYSIPLYRQHQRLKYDGFHLARSTLSANFIRAGVLLQRLMEPLQYSILLSRILAIDETPIKVGVDKSKNKMKRGYIWPLLGDRQEIIYVYHQSRGAKVLEELLKDFHGTILSDGYSAYKSYINSIIEDGTSPDVTHATCWVHARRKFVQLENTRPAEFEQASRFFAELYKIEAEIKADKKINTYIARQQRSLLVVDRYFNWLRSFNGKPELATNELLRNAVSYSIEREVSMRVFLRDPDLQLDTNHLERQIRPIAIGRKNWMFCWTELGAECLCAAQSLIRTCILQGVHPREYLIDILPKLARADEGDDISDLLPAFYSDLANTKPKTT